MSTATFIGYDLITGPNWQAPTSVRGTAGYWLSDTDANTLVVSLPSYITGVDHSAFSWAGAGNSPLTRPGGGAPLYGRYYTIGASSAPVTVTDGALHYLSIYCADDVGGGRTQIVTILDASDAPLASHTTSYNFEGGVWLCFQVSGVVKVQLQVSGASPNAVFSGMVWDETQPALANAQTTIPTTGSMTLDPVTATGSGTSGGSSIAATGSLALDAVAPAGTASNVVPTTGAMTLGAMTATGSSTTTINATGSLTVDSIAVAGNAAPPATATFIGKDLITGGDWQATATRRGTAGYWLSDSDAATVAQSLPAYVTSVDHSDPSLTWDGGSYASTRLTRPGGGAALVGRYYTVGTADVLVNATDGVLHYLSIYCADNPGTNRTQSISIVDGAGAPLASHAINYNFDTGVWLCFRVSGFVKVQLQVTGAAPNAVVSGLTWDETQPPTATAGSSIPTTGAMTLAPMTVTGSSGSSDAATGSLAVESAVFAASAGVTVHGSGAMTVGSVGVAGSSQSVISATGSMAAGSVAMGGSAGLTIHATGALALGSAGATGTAALIVSASGSLAVASATATGSTGVMIAATGSLAVDSVVTYSQSLIAATGSLTLDDATTTGVATTMTYVTSQPFNAYLATCVADASGKCNCTGS